MLNNRNSIGQEAIEFAFIGGLVFCAAIGTLLIFGNKITSFFQNDSAAAKIANNSQSNIYSNAPGNYSADYKTVIENNETLKEIEDLENITSINIGGVEVSNIPENISTTIQTSGIAGSTDLINSSISNLAQKLKVLSDENPDNSDLKEIADLTQDLSQKGQLVADAEEWFETAANFRDLNTNKLTVPEDNKIHEGGSEKESLKYANDNYIHIKDYIYKRPWLFNTLAEHTDSFKNINSKINNLSQNQTEEVKNIVDIVNTLSGSIIEISDNVKTTVKNKKAHSSNDFLNNVASKTTDLKSKFIEKQANKDSLLNKTAI